MMKQIYPDLRPLVCVRQEINGMGYKIGFKEYPYGLAEQQMAVDVFAALHMIRIMMAGQ